MNDVLPYADPHVRNPRSRLPLTAFLWSLLSPAIVAGILFLILEGPLLDLDDLLPRDSAIAVLAAVVGGVPLAGVLMSVAGLSRASTTGQRVLAVAGLVIGVFWIILGCLGLSAAIRA